VVFCRIFSELGLRTRVRTTPNDTRAGGRYGAVGGWDETGNAVGSLEIYDPRTNRWTWGRSMPTARGIAGVAWSGNRLYAIGGVDNNDDPVANVESYNPETNTWQERAPVPTPRSHPAVATLDDGHIIVAGGGPPTSETADVEVYTPSSNTWQQLTALPVATIPTGAVVGRMFYVISGFVGGSPKEVTRSVWAAVVR
jgi:N-acetylneuraminic acid mutarotase